MCSTLSWIINKSKFAKRFKRVLEDTDSDSLSILYEPDYGTFRLDQMTAKNTPGDAYNVFNQIDKFLTKYFIFIVFLEI